MLLKLLIDIIVVRNKNEEVVVDYSLSIRNPGVSYEITCGDKKTPLPSKEISQISSKSEEIFQKIHGQSLATAAPFTQLGKKITTLETLAKDLSDQKTNKTQMTAFAVLATVLTVATVAAAVLVCVFGSPIALIGLAIPVLLFVGLTTFLFVLRAITIAEIKKMEEQTESTKNSINDLLKETARMSHDQTNPLNDNSEFMKKLDLKIQELQNGENSEKNVDTKKQLLKELTDHIQARSELKTAYDQAILLGKKIA